MSKGKIPVRIFERARRIDYKSEGFEDRLKEFSKDINDINFKTKDMGKEIKKLKKEQNRFYFNIIEILSIFIVIIGLLFSSIKFIEIARFSFNEILGLLVILAAIFFGLILGVHFLVRIR